MARVGAMEAAIRAYRRSHKFRIGECLSLNVPIERVLPCFKDAAK